MSGNTQIKITPKEYLKEGAMVKVTKVTMHQRSDVKVGSVSYGNLKNSLQVGQILSLHNTSFKTTTIKFITQTVASDFIVNTETSVYFVQKI
jgi:hypothetical protein